MNVLLLGGGDTKWEDLRGLEYQGEAIDLLSPRRGQVLPEEASVDIIVSGDDFSLQSPLGDELLAWRTHPHTFLTPCWIQCDRREFEGRCLWPRLSIDRFDPVPDASEFTRWLGRIVQWQQDRLQVSRMGSFEERALLEVLTSLSLRRATGKLAVFGEEGEETVLLLSKGALRESRSRFGPERQQEILADLLARPRGNYLWEPGEGSGANGDGGDLASLLQEVLGLIRDANLLFRFLRDLGQPVRKTESQSALDDRADPFFGSQQEMYNLIDGKLTAAQLIDCSPVSRPRAMAFLAKFLSMGDIAACEGPSTAIRRMLLVDDSKLMCRALGEIFASDPRFRIVGVAHDGQEALEAMELHHPDVITMDIQMPRMDGLAALKRIMIRDPRPVVILSAFTTETSHLTYESFKYGAVDVITKPDRTGKRELEEQSRDLRDRVALAAAARLDAVQYIRGPRKGCSAEGLAEKRRTDGGPASRLVAAACGAGGFPSLMRVLFSVSSMEELPCLVVCVAMPPAVVESLAPNLDEDCLMPVRLLVPSEPLRSGTCYLYSFRKPFRLVGGDEGIRAEEDEEGKAGQALDLLLATASSLHGGETISLLISGSGTDGLEGMRCVRRHGGRTFVLSSSWCLRPELPERALAEGLGVEIESIARLAKLLESPWTALSRDDPKEGEQG